MYLSGCSASWTAWQTLMEECADVEWVVRFRLGIDEMLCLPYSIDRLKHHAISRPTCMITSPLCSPSTMAYPGVWIARCEVWFSTWLEERATAFQAISSVAHTQPSTPVAARPDRS